MNDLRFLENRYLIKDSPNQIIKGTDEVSRYCYSIEENEIQYRAEILLEKTTVEFRYSYLMKIGSGNMWMPLELAATPLWFQAIIKEIEALKDANTSSLESQKKRGKIFSRDFLKRVLR